MQHQILVHSRNVIYTKAHKIKTFLQKKFSNEIFEIKILDSNDVEHYIYLKVTTYTSLEGNLSYLVVLGDYERQLGLATVMMYHYGCAVLPLSLIPKIIGEKRMKYFFGENTKHHSLETIYCALKRANLRLAFENDKEALNRLMFRGNLMAGLMPNV